MDLLSVSSGNSAGNGGIGEYFSRTQVPLTNDACPRRQNSRRALVIVRPRNNL